MIDRLKTIVLWLALIGLFIGFYSGGLTAWWFTTCFIVVIGAIVALNRFERTRPWRKAADAANQAFQRGHFGEAAAGWEQASAAKPKELTYQFNVGSARLMLFHLDAAAKRFEVAKGLAKAASERTVVEVHQRVIDALAGREPKPSTGNTPFVALEALVAALEFLKAGNYAAARERLRTTEARQNNATLGELVRALEAWCAFELGEGRQTVDSVLLFRESSGAELKAAWPRFAEFIEPQR